MSVSAGGSLEIVREDACEPGGRLREQLRERGESRANRCYWLIVGGGLYKENPFNRRVSDGGVSNGDVFAVSGKLAVFSFMQEAQACLRFRVPGEGWHVRVFGAGELVSRLYGSWNGFGRVALDPPSEIEDCAVDALIAVDRTQFAELLVRRGDPRSDGLSAVDHSRPTQGGGP